MFPCCYFETGNKNINYYIVIGITMLHTIDIIILFAYFLAVMAIGLLVSGRAKGSIGEYFLGGRHIPWYILGISGMATFLSLSGSMHIVSLYFLFGVKGFWITLRGHMCLFLAFLMIFMAKWLNRSGVMTNAEWIVFRFGSGKQGKTARLLSAISTLFVSIAIMAFFFVAAEKFFALYIPMEPRLVALIFFAIVMIYTVAAGFHGVVYTDLFQSVLVIGVIAFISFKAMTTATPDYFSNFASADWRSIMPSWEMATPENYEGLHFFGLLIIFWLVSNILQGFAQPTDGFVSQRYYAARNERESALIAWQWIVLLSVRFLMMTGIAVLALGITGTFTDPEKAFPAVIDHFFPAGAKGLVLASLIAAEMSSLDSIANSSAAYLVKDIYQALLNPKASDKTLIRMSYIATALLFTVSALIGMAAPNLDSLWAWTVMGLITGLLPSGILKWVWWRFNGAGYAAGVISGITAAVLHTVIFDNPAEYVTFIFVFAVSMAGTVLGTFLGKPSPMETLIAFYTRTRPFGFWEPVRQLCDPVLVQDIHHENRRDLLLLVPATIWQALVFWLMSAVIVKRWDSVALSLAGIAILSAILYKYWYLNLKSPEQQRPPL